MKKKIIFSVLSIIICIFMLFGCCSSGPDNIVNIRGESAEANNAPSKGSFTLTFVNKTKDGKQTIDLSGMNEASRLELSEDSYAEFVSTSSTDRIKLSEVQIVSTNTDAADLSDSTVTVKVSYEGVPCDEYFINTNFTFLYYEDGVNLKDQYSTPYGVSVGRITVAPQAPIVLTEALPEGEARMDYSATLEAFSDISVAWSVSEDTPLPEGLSLDGESGVISGKAQTDGEYEITFVATNDKGSDSKSLKLKINAHEHVFGEFIVEEDMHYKECRCGEISEKAEHSLQEVIDKQPTYTETGSKHSVCTVCGYETAAEEIPMLEKPEPTATPEPTKAPADNADKAKTENISTGANDSVMAYAVIAAVAATLLVFALRKKVK